MKTIVYLTGYPGCGKSTVGKKLAKGLNYKFYDLDKEIEKKAGMSVNGIFEKYGEEKFREMESEVLTELSKAKNAVIATGGGTPCYNNNPEIIESTGLSVYLKMPPAALAVRLINAKTKRPLLKNISKDKLINHIEEQLKEREIFYKKADLIVDAQNTEIVSLMTLIKKYQKNNF